MARNNIELDEKVVERLARKIVIRENRELKRGMVDSKMVEWIRKQIEEEAKCKLNR